MRRALVAVACAMALSVGSLGCSPAKPDAAAQKAQCFQNMQLVGMEMKLFLADTGEYPPLSTVLQKMGRRCPSGGTYSFDEKTGVLSCSIHGKYKP
jgi:hypothetical protein